MACDNEVVKVPPIFICHVTKLKYNYLHERANFHLQNKGILKRGEINSQLGINGYFKGMTILKF